MAKAVKKTKRSKNNLLFRMSAGADSYEEKVIRFQNDDVLDYLRDLARFEKESRKTHIVVQ